ncbi:hypothetical protein Tco_1161534, partial [Tanacetum coccineum]
VTGFVDSDYAKDPDKEAEYVALTKAMKEAIWLRGLLEELGVELNIVAVNCDNQGGIHLSRNHVFHERTKHINVCYHFIREILEAKTVKVLKVGTEHNATAALTKVVPRLKFQHCLELLCLDKQSDEKTRHKNPNSRGWSRNAKIPSLASDAADVKLPFVVFSDGRI